jgi:hypothetical protein
MKLLHDEGIGYLVEPIDPMQLLEQPDKIRDWPSASVYVLDEAYKVWPAGLNTREIPTSHKEFFTEHRHTGEDGYSREIILVTQDVKQLAHNLCLNIEKTFITRKRTQKGEVGEKQYRTTIYDGAVSRTRLPAEYENTLTGTYRKEVFQYYKSHTKSKGVLKEMRLDKRASMWNHPAIKTVLPLSVLGMAFFVWGFFESLHSVEDKLVDEKAEQSQAPQPAPISGPKQPPKPSRSFNLPRLDGETDEAYQERFEREFQNWLKTQGLKAPPTPDEIGLQTLQQELAALRAQVNRQQQEKKLPLSEDWRINSYIQAQGRQIVTVANRYGDTRRVDPGACMEVYGSLECRISGELITEWSGNKHGGIVTGAQPFSSATMGARQGATAPAARPSVAYW